MTTAPDIISIPEADDWMKDFLQELSVFPINRKLQALVDEHCRKEGSSQTEFLYGICYMVALSALTPYQIAERTGIELKTIKLLVNNLNNMLRKLDRLGETYLHTLYDRYPDLYKNDASSTVQVNRFFDKGFDLLASQSEPESSS